MTDKQTSTPQSTPVAGKLAESEGHIDHMKDAIEDAAETIVARVEHERAEHERASHDGRVHHAREAIQEALDKIGDKLPGAKH